MISITVQLACQSTQGEAPSPSAPPPGRGNGSGRCGYNVITINLGEEWAQLETEFGLSSEHVLVNPGEETYVGELLVNPEE